MILIITECLYLSICEFDVWWGLGHGLEEGGVKELEVLAFRTFFRQTLPLRLPVVGRAKHHGHKVHIMVRGWKWEVTPPAIGHRILKGKHEVAVTCTEANLNRKKSRVLTLAGP